MRNLTPNLWFDTQAEEAAHFYVSIFDNSKIGIVTRYSDIGAQASGMPAGSVMTISFELEGKPFVAINGGPVFKFTEAVSFQIDCATQEEIDMFTEKLIADSGSQQPCGWIKDKYGLSWQVVPEGMDELAQDPVKFERAMGAMMQMEKIDMAVLKQAYEGN